jgi:cytochrome c biogenesis protein CcmG/thiol:disulfide interchange protein DsbE
MNKHLRALIVVLILAAVGGAVALVVKSRREQQVSSAEGEKPVVAINKQLPDFESKTIKNEPIKLSQFAGKIVILNFWASWCGPCVEEMPSLIKLVQAFPNDIDLVAISGDSNMEDIESFMKSFPELKTQPNIHMIFDQDKKLSQQYQVYRLPESFVLDRTQKMVKKISGTIDWHTEDAMTYMQELIHPPSKVPPPDAPKNLPELED